MLAEAPPAPLSIAAALHQLAPPPLHIAILADRLANSSSTATLHSLATRYLTNDHAYQVIQAETAVASAAEFVRHFSNEVFPLMTEHIPLEDEFPDEDGYDENAQFAVNLLLNGIPYRLHGFDYCEELHEMHRWTYPSLLVVGLFLNYADITSNDRPQTRYDDQAIRHIWREHLENTCNVPPELLALPPEFGYAPSHFISAVADTEHAGAGQLATVFAQQTDNVFLSWYNSEEYLEFNDPWTDSNIAEATELWEEAKPIITGMSQYIQEHADALPQLFQDLHELVSARPIQPQGAPR